MVFEVRLSSYEYSGREIHFLSSDWYSRQCVYTILQVPDVDVLEGEVFRNEVSVSGLVVSACFCVWTEIPC
jgi:hypothetical protein